MLLVIDVGNTNMVLGLYNNNTLYKTWRINTQTPKTSDELGITILSLFKNISITTDVINDVVIASVVPNIMYTLTRGIKKYIGIQPMVISADMDLGIKIIRDDPRECGIDRIVDIVAAKELYGTPAIVIDYGTANTFDVINENNEFITGFITAGVKICADELYSRSAQLPKVELISPKSIVATDTVSSLQVGIVAGRIGETIGIINALKNGLNIPNAKVIATGGLANIIDPNKKIFDIYDPILTLTGIKILYNRNK